MGENEEGKRGKEGEKRKREITFFSKSFQLSNVDEFERGVCNLINFLFRILCYLFVCFCLFSFLFLFLF